MNKNLKKLIVCVMAVAAVATTNVGSQIIPAVVANAATVESSAQDQKYIATVVSVNDNTEAEKVGSIFNDIFTVNDVLKTFEVDTQNVTEIAEIEISASDKENIAVSKNANFLKTIFDIAGESSKSTKGTQIRIRYTMNDGKTYTLKFKVKMSEDVTYKAEVVSSSIDGKKGNIAATLDDTFTVKTALETFDIDTKDVTVTDVKVSETDSEKINVSDADTKDYDLNTRFDVTNISTADNVKGTQIRIRYTKAGDKKEHTLKFNVYMSEKNINI